MPQFAHKYMVVLEQRLRELNEAEQSPSAKMSGRECRNVFENLRLRQRKSLGRSSLVNSNKPNAGAGYALRLSACCSRL